MDTVARQRVARLLTKLASDYDGEIVATVTVMRRVLQSSGYDLHDLARALAPAETCAPTPSAGQHQPDYAPRPMSVPAKLIWLCTSPTVSGKLHSTVMRTLRAALARYERIGVGGITPADRDLINQAYKVYGPENQT